jgi:uncharacterized protein involved in response to NO
MLAYAWVGILTCTTYTLAGFAREQVCTWMCPWPRLQGAIWDPEASTVNYRDHRGEPRGSAKKALELRAKGEPAGDCVDCMQCVNVCPIGIDIREGPNFACINCGLCVDACDTTMAKLGRPRGLIDYVAWSNIERERRKEPGRNRLIRPKTVGLGLSIAALLGIMSVSFSMRNDAKVTVIHDRNPVAVRLSDGRTRTATRSGSTTKLARERSFHLDATGLHGATVEVVGEDGAVSVASDTTRELRVLVTAPADDRQPIAFTATDVASGRCRDGAGRFHPSRRRPMMAPIPRLRDYTGPALLSYGFRPFFLLGSLYAGLAILAWLPMFYGELELSTIFAPARLAHSRDALRLSSRRDHRLPADGGAELDRTHAASGKAAARPCPDLGCGPCRGHHFRLDRLGAAAVVDNAFLLLVAAAMSREIVKGRNWRNIKVLITLGVLTAGNIVFHVESHVLGVADYGVRFGIAATMMLIMLVGGRIIPSFTRNWLVRENPGRLPASFGTFDVVSVAAAGTALLAWIVAPVWQVTGAALIAAGVLQAVRLARWAGERTWQNRLVLILHIGYAFVPLGFVLSGLASLELLSTGAGIHAWTGGAMGIMTLAVMSRASLGHTGRALAATAAVQAIYLLLVVAALARICASIHPAWSGTLLHIAGGAWAAAFVGFALAYWTVFTRPRVTA